MTVSRRIAIAPITAPELSPPALAEAAAAGAYTDIGIRLLPSIPSGFAWGLIDDPALLRETRSRLEATGIGVLDIDIIRLRDDSRPASFIPFLDTGQALGARSVLVVADDPEPGRLTDNFAALCDLAALRGLTADIEFMPWSTVPDLAAALRLLHRVKRPNAGIVVDTLHVDRSFTPISALAGIPPDWLHYAQICDAPAEQPATLDAMIHCARSERLFPGEGGLDLAGMMRALPKDLPISVEVPRETLARTVGPAERASRAIAATRRVLGTVG